MTDRQDYIAICARKVFEAQADSISETVDDVFKTLNTKARAWYASRTPAQLRRFDADVYIRVIYLKGLQVVAQIQTC